MPRHENINQMQSYHSTDPLSPPFSRIYLLLEHLQPPKKQHSFSLSQRERFSPVFRSFEIHHPQRQNKGENQDCS